MTDQRGVKMGMARVGAVAALALVLASCSGGSSSEDAAAKFTQTWTKAYSATTCAEYKTSMTEDQQRVLAADMLVSSRSVDKIETFPSDDLIQTFRSGLATACVVDTMKMTEMGAGLYLTERDRWQD